MKHIIFISTLLIFSTAIVGQQKPVSAEVIIKDAMAKASKAHKNVFVIFHASWCGWCHKMENAMNDASIKDFFEKNYVVEHITIDESKDKKDLENPGGDELRKKYHGDEQGLPYWFIIDANGNFLADSRLKTESDANAKAVSVGCPAEKDEVTYFTKVLKKTSRLTDAQLGLIEQRFLKNKE